MHFGTKSYLKSIRNHTAKHALRKLAKFPTVAWQPENGWSGSWHYRS